MGVALRVHAGGALVADSHLMLRTQVLYNVCTISINTLVPMSNLINNCIRDLEFMKVVAPTEHPDEMIESLIPLLIFKNINYLFNIASTYESN